MALIRWNPWNFPSLSEDDWVNLPTIPGLSRITGQGLNIYETDEAVVAEAALPGIPEDKVDVTVDDGVVTVSGSSEEKQEEKGKKRFFLTSMASSYNYSFRLPEGVLTDLEPQCMLENGILKLVFEKAKKAPPKKIKVTSTKK